jgi:uncharacterized protein YjbI with pentapeptide repeats
MDRDEALKLLEGGPEGIKEWNRRRSTGEKIPDLSAAKLIRADLSRADLSGVSLSRARLSGADLSGADLSGACLPEASFMYATLSGANLRRADLRGADFESATLGGADLGRTDLRGADLLTVDLSGANLSGANLSGFNLGMHDLSRVNLSGADLSGVDLRSVKLSGANLRGANLRGTNLSELVFSEFDFRGADFSEADLTLTRLIRCRLDEAVFDNAIVTDCQVQESIGRPKPPSLLRVKDRDPLTGEDARNFFNPLATIEVYLTEILTDEELGAFRFHLGDMRRQGVGIGVYLTGEWQEAGSTILRFQAPTYIEIYDVLPTLLKPFRTTRAVDWAKTYESLPEQERGSVLTALAKIETADPEGKWLFAHRMAELSHRFFNAKIVQIREGRSQGVLIKIASNQAVERRLAQLRKPAIPQARFQLTYYENHSMTNEVKGNIVGSNFGTGNTLNAREITFQQLWNQAGGSIDLPALANELGQLRSALRKEASEPEHDEALGAVASAEKAAKQGDGPKALEYLKAAGK